MEPRGRRGSRPPVETAASQEQPIPLSGEPAPMVEPPLIGDPPAADDPGARTGDSLTAITAAEEALAGGTESEALAGETEAPVAPAAPPAAEARETPDRDSLMALTRAQAALTRGLAALGFEIAGLACAEFANAARAASRLIAVRTPSEAARLQADYWRHSLDAALSGSARLSNLGVAVAAETAEPLVAQFARNWLRAERRAG